MVGVAALAGRRAGAIAASSRPARQQGEAGAFADARCRRDRRRRGGTAPSERAPASESRTAWSGTGCRPAYHRRVAQAGGDRARRGSEHLGAGRAGGGDHHRRSAQTELAPARTRPPSRCCACGIVEVGRQCPGCVALPVGEFRLVEFRKCWCRRIRRCAGPKRSRACAAAVAKPSCCSASWASRLLRQSNSARSARTGARARSWIWPTKVLSVTVSNAQGASPERRSCSACSVAASPTPMLLATVMWRR